MGGEGYREGMLGIKMKVRITDRGEGRKGGAYMVESYFLII